MLSQRLCEGKLPKFVGTCTEGKKTCVRTIRWACWQVWKCFSLSSTSSKWDFFSCFRTKFHTSTTKWNDKWKNNQERGEKNRKKAEISLLIAALLTHWVCICFVQMFTPFICQKSGGVFHFFFCRKNFFTPPAAVVCYLSQNLHSLEINVVLSISFRLKH